MKDSPHQFRLIDCISNAIERKDIYPDFDLSAEFPPTEAFDKNPTKAELGKTCKAIKEILKSLDESDERCQVYWELSSDVSLKLAIKFKWLDEFLAKNHVGTPYTNGEALLALLKDIKKEKDSFSAKDLKRDLVNGVKGKTLYQALLRLLGSLTSKAVEVVRERLAEPVEIDFEVKSLGRLTLYRVVNFLEVFLSQLPYESWCLRRLIEFDLETDDGLIKGNSVYTWLSRKHGVNSVYELEQFCRENKIAHEVLFFSEDAHRHIDRKCLKGSLKRFFREHRSNGHLTWRRRDIEEWNDPILSLSGHGIMSHITRHYPDGINSEFLEDLLGEEYGEVVGELEHDVSQLKVFSSADVVVEFIQNFISQNSTPWTLTNLMTWSKNGVNGRAACAWIKRNCMQSKEVTWLEAFQGLNISTEDFQSRS